MAITASSSMSVKAAIREECGLLAERRRGVPKAFTEINLTRVFWTACVELPKVGALLSPRAG